MENSFAIIPLALVLLAFISKSLLNRHPLPKFPPGPKPWPIIGNLNLIGPIPHQSLHSLSKKYGKIMQLKFGKFPVVVASSPEMAKQFLMVHDTVFASRPPLAAGKYTSFNYSNMTWAPYGPHWRQARKIYAAELFNAKTLESFEHIGTQERRNLLSRLHSLSRNNAPVVIRDELSRYAISSISMMVFSNKYFTEPENDDHHHKSNNVKLDELKEMLGEWFWLNGAINIGDWIPWLDFLDLQGHIKKMKALQVKWDKFLSSVIDDARRRGREKHDMLDVLLELAENPNHEVKLTLDCVKGLLQDLLTGATDTSTTTIEWIICEIMKQPRIMVQAKEELDRVIGRERWADEKDLPQLPYMEAIIMESMRVHPPATLLAPHYAMEDCKVDGFDISKGTTVFINTWAIGRDPQLWDAPQQFLPERFLEDNVEMDMLGNNYALLPFGSGRRRCPGYKLGLKGIRMTLANLLQGFDLKLVEGMSPEDICLDELYGLTTHPKHPLSIVLESRLPDQLYASF